MEYAKPAVVVLSSAFKAVRSGGKSNEQPPDADHILTNGAYEADE